MREIQYTIQNTYSLQIPDTIAEKLLCGCSEEDVNFIMDVGLCKQIKCIPVNVDVREADGTWCSVYEK